MFYTIAVHVGGAEVNVPKTPAHAGITEVIDGHLKYVPAVVWGVSVLYRTHQRG